MVCQQITLIDTNSIVAGNNDRTIFDPRDLASLADSIRENGLLQPITVRLIDGTELYEIVAGERRFRACKTLNWDTVPAIVADLTSEEASALMLAENTARADLDPIDEARAYAHRINNEGWDVEDCARKAGVSTVHVHFRLKLLTLRDDLQHLVRYGNLPLGYAQILADGRLDSNRQQIALRRLQANDHPTPAWFRTVVNDLAAEQQQESLFDLDNFMQIQTIPAPAEKPATPPTPATHKAPSIEGSATEKIQHQINFWNQAAEDWQRLGKSFKRNECQAAASALQHLMETL